MRIRNSISPLLLPCLPFSVLITLVACSPTVRNFGGAGGGGGDGGGSGGDVGDEECFSPFTLCSGVCTDTSLDTAHCGACGNSCSAPAGAVSTCESSTCGYKCDRDHKDCNGVSDDGCETDITKDIANCGLCGNRCPEVRDATATCASGMCGFVCDRGVSDCSPTVPGCETAVLNDPSNCGGCGRFCERGQVCRDGSCVRGLTGATGDAWEPVPANMSGTHGFQDFVSSDSPYIYVASSTGFGRYNIAGSTWEQLAAAPVPFPFWGSPAAANGFIWGVCGLSVIRYDPSNNVWTTVRRDIRGGDEQSMTVADDIGHLWSFNSAKELIEYDTVTDTVQYHPTGIMDNTYETRLGFDRVANSIFFAGFQSAVIQRFELRTRSVSATAPHPEGSLNDIFCADRSGHIYAAGGGSGTTMWQYDTAANSWRQIPDFPVDHSNNGSCGVQEDGWLYVETGTTSANVYRLRLF